ncbi:MAG: SpoIID/LytB domain-containing protein [Vampirovibrionia bacterium]
MFKFYHLILIFTVSLFLSGQIFAQSRDVEEQLIRVGISTNDFSALEYSSVRVSADSTFYIVDLSNENRLVKALSGAVYTISVNSKGFNVAINGSVLFSSVCGPIGISSPGGHVKLVDVSRKGKTAAYRGNIEVVRASSSLDKISVVNVLPMDQYLKGVVPNELPVSFGFEALKAQAVAARNYAVRPREKPYPQFDICDSVMCQVYFGYYTENTLSNSAVEETAGLVALHKGEVITALYSSAPGGFSGSYENAFSDPQSKDFPSESKPYLVAKSDNQAFSDLSSEEMARKFYTSSPASYDVKSSYYRWNRSWTGSELEKVLNMNLAKFSNAKDSAPFVKPAFGKTSSVGKLRDIKVLRRCKSGKAMELQITGTNGTWVVQKELNIRRILTSAGKALPSANIVIDLYKDSSGIITQVKLFGGGFGHGVGMSQYGASYMSSKGFSFDKILQHYYTGIAIGTIPVLLYKNEFMTPIKQEFYSPKGQAILWYENEGVSTITIKINGKDLVLNENNGYSSKKSVDISSYIHKGLNDIVYYPPASEEDEGLSVKLWIELEKAR